MDAPAIGVHVAAPKVAVQAGRRLGGPGQTVEASAHVLHRRHPGAAQRPRSLAICASGNRRRCA